MDKSVIYEAITEFGRERKQTSERRDLREERKRYVESMQEIGGGPPTIDENYIKQLIDLGMKEAELIDGFDPDLLIVTKSQYQIIFDIPAAVPIDPTDWPEIHQPVEAQQTLPPLKLERRSGGSIDVTYSNRVKGMLLVESGSL